MAKDVHGNEVIVGSKVKVLTIDPLVLAHLLDEEAFDIRSMIGEVFEVYEVTEKFASVEKWWQDDDSHSHCHSIALNQNEMELCS